MTPDDIPGAPRWLLERMDALKKLPPPTLEKVKRRMKASTKIINKRKPKPTLSDIFNTDGLVFWSFRYFLGRMTAATCVFAENLAEAWPLLSDKNKYMISKELEDAFRQDDEIKAKAEYTPLFFRPLGHDCDREAWEKVRRAYTTH